MYEPNFELIFKSEGNAVNEENNIEVNTKKEETVNDIMPIEQRIKEYVNDDNAILEFIDDSDSDLWKTKLVFVTSQSGRGLYRVNDSYIKLIDDSNIIANVETIRSYINMLSQIAGTEQLIDDIIKYYNNAINGLDVNDEFYSMKIPEWNYNGYDVANAIDELILSNDRFCII